MDAEYKSASEADKIIARWASRGTAVIYVEELGDLAVFTQRRGLLEMVRPGLSIHRAGETFTTVFPARFGEVVHVEDDAYEIVMLRRPAGANGLEITLIADWTEDLEPNDVLLLVQTARGIRAPLQ